MFPGRVKPWHSNREDREGLFKAGCGRAAVDLMEQLRRKWNRSAPVARLCFRWCNGSAASGGAFVEGEAAAQLKLRTQRQPSMDILATQFLPCTSGLRGMYYDAVASISCGSNGETVEVSSSRSASVADRRVAVRRNSGRAGGLKVDQHWTRIAARIPRRSSDHGGGTYFLKTARLANHAFNDRLTSDQKTLQPLQGFHEAARLRSSASIRFADAVFHATAIGDLLGVHFLGPYDSPRVIRS